MPGLLTELADRARVLSITASSAIEGVIVADADRAQRIISKRAVLHLIQQEAWLAREPTGPASGRIRCFSNGLRRSGRCTIPAPS
jgi:hypothetical protein